MTDNNARLFTFGSSANYLTLPDRQVAAKTGTTQDFRDGWTMGFTPSLVAGVWTGNNNNEPMKQDAVMTAGPIWNSFMKAATKGKPVETFQVPEGIKQVTVDAVSGKLPGQFTLETRTEVFADYAVPTEYDDVHVGVKIDSDTGLPATSLTSPDKIVIQPFTIFHSEKPENPSWENPVREWAIAAGFTYPGGETIDPSSPGGDSTTLNLEVTSPSDNASISKLPFEVNVSVSPPNEVARIDLAIDGQLVQSLNSGPFVFAVNKKYPDGKHTIAIHAVDKNGKTKDTSLSVTYSLDGAGTFNMTDPANGDSLEFPVGLNSESTIKYSSVTYYYQTGGTTKTIGSVSGSNAINGRYTYPLTWINPPKPGNYLVYAKSNTGVITSKINVEIK
jgi:membrane carboxypeptidase/penicillin-binding protein PbpC